MKRAQSGLRTNSMIATAEGEQGFWPSFADMMSSFALILFFLMLISYLQNLITGNRLISTEDQLKETELTLSLTRQQVTAAQEELASANSNLSTVMSELAIANTDLETARQTLILQQSEMDEYSATIAGQTLTISEQERQIAEQKAYIALTNEELIRLRSQMQTIALLRLSILEKIKTSIGRTLGDESKVSIGDNGSIILNEGLFFDYNSSTIKSESYQLLNELTAAFSEFLSDRENAKYVDSIVISGHTDDTGTDKYNRELSTARANAVLTYLLERNRGILQPYAQYFCAAGYGSTRPVQSNSTEAGRCANRRIEISIILKDETVLEIVNTYLAAEAPEAVTGAGGSGN